MKTVKTLIATVIVALAITTGAVADNSPPLGTGSTGSQVGNISDSGSGPYTVGDTYTVTYTVQETREGWDSGSCSLVYGSNLSQSATVGDQTQSATTTVDSSDCGGSAPHTTSSPYAAWWATKTFTFTLGTAGTYTVTINGQGQTATVDTITVNDPPAAPAPTAPAPPTTVATKPEAVDYYTPWITAWKKYRSKGFLLRAGILPGDSFS